MGEIKFNISRDRLRQVRKERVAIGAMSNGGPVSLVWNPDKKWFEVTVGKADAAQAVMMPPKAGDRNPLGDAMRRYLGERYDSRKMDDALLILDGKAVAVPKDQAGHSTPTARNVANEAEGLIGAVIRYLTTGGASIVSPGELRQRALQARSNINAILAGDSVKPDRAKPDAADVARIAFSLIDTLEGYRLTENFDLGGVDTAVAFTKQRLQQLMGLGDDWPLTAQEQADAAACGVKPAPSPPETAPIESDDAVDHSPAKLPEGMAWNMGTIVDVSKPGRVVKAGPAYESGKIEPFVAGDIIVAGQPEGVVSMGQGGRIHAVWSDAKGDWTPGPNVSLRDMPDGRRFVTVRNNGLPDCYLAESPRVTATPYKGEWIGAD